MHKSGKTNHKLAECFGLEIRQIKNRINRHNQSQAHPAAGLLTKYQGHPRKYKTPTNIQTYPYKIEHLKTENKPLWSFLE